LVPDKLQGKRDAREPTSSAQCAFCLSSINPSTAARHAVCIKRQTSSGDRGGRRPQTSWGGDDRSRDRSHLGHLAHAGSFGKTEQVLAVGAICALIAVGVQAAIGPGTTTLCMGAARYI
jgi:hypothetical protein